MLMLPYCADSTLVAFVTMAWMAATPVLVPLPVRVGGGATASRQRSRASERQVKGFSAANASLKSWCNAPTQGLLCLHTPFTISFPASGTKVCTGVYPCLRVPPQRCSNTFCRMRDDN